MNWKKRIYCGDVTSSDRGKDILLLKVLAKREKARREGREIDDHPLWDSPLYELITGQVGDRLRGMRCMMGS